MHDVCRSEDCMNKLCKYFKEHAMKLINFEKNKLIPLTKCRNQMLVQKYHIFKTVLRINTLMTRNFLKIEIIVITEVNTEVLHIIYVTVCFCLGQMVECSFKN